MGSSENYLSLVLHSKSWTASIPLFAVPGIILFAQALLAQSEAGNMAEQLRGNTVRVQAAQNGFGFIVGARGGSLYIVTARHVIVGVNDDPDAAPQNGAKVVFYADQGKPYSAEVLGTHEGDLAVLRVAAPPGLQWARSCVAGSDKQNRGTSVWFVGKGDKWSVPVNPGAISSERPDTKSLLEIDGLSVSPGTSGAPLIASTGIVGMIQNDSAYDTRALTIDFIQRAIQQWNYPWDLTAGRVTPQRVIPQEDSTPTPVPQTCSLDIDSNPSGAGIKVNGASRGKTPDRITLTRGTSYGLSLSLDGYKVHQERIDCGTDSVNAKMEAQVGTITVAYTGDLFACSLDLTMKIGNKAFHPTSNQYGVGGIPLGKQSYTVTGQIGCPLSGMCVASGSGSIEVRDGATYSVQWANVAYGGCRVLLSGN